MAKKSSLVRMVLNSLVLSLTRMLVVTSTSPEVANLLGLKIAWCERGAAQWWRRDLENRKGDIIVAEWLSNTWNGRNQWRKRECNRLGSKQPCKGCAVLEVHLENE